MLITDGGRRGGLRMEASRWLCNDGHVGTLSFVALGWRRAIDGNVVPRMDVV